MALFTTLSRGFGQWEGEINRLSMEYQMNPTARRHTSQDRLSSLLDQSLSLL